MEHCETHFVTFWISFHQNNVKEGRPKLDNLKLRGLILMVKYIRKYMKFGVRPIQSKSCNVSFVCGCLLVLLAGIRNRNDWRLGCQRVYQKNYKTNNLFWRFAKKAASPSQQKTCLGESAYCTQWWSYQGRVSCSLGLGVRLFQRYFD